MADQQEDGGPAFPIETTATPYAPGMSLRDWFAGQALAGLCANSAWDDTFQPKHYQTFSTVAYGLSDAMLAAREAAARIATDAAAAIRAIPIAPQPDPVEHWRQEVGKLHSQVERLKHIVATQGAEMERRLERAEVAEAALAAPQPVAVTVKPLVWEKKQSHAGDSYWRSDFGHEIWATSTNTFAEMETGKRFDFRSDAIKFVQTIHEARFLSALTIHPYDPLSDPRVVALVEALRFYEDAESYDYTYEQLPCECCTDIFKPVERDNGDTARAALRAIGGEA